MCLQAGTRMTDPNPESYLSRIMNFEESIHRFDSLDFLCEMLFLFITKYKNINIDLDTLYAETEENPRAFYELIHKIKGVLQNFSFNEIQESIININSKSKSNEKVSQIELEKLKSDFNELFALLENFFEVFPELKPK